jgi:class 3 adenylate cyclase
MGRAVERHDEIVRAATEGAGGLLVREKGEGDSTFSVFDDAEAALHAAVSLQRAIAAERWLTKEPIVVRAGIHTDEVEPRDGDLCGGAVKRAARIREIAAGSSIVLSAAALAASEDHLPPDTWIVDLGTHRLRGLVGVEQIYALVHVDLSRSPYLAWH